MTAARKPPIGRFYELQKEVSVPEPYVLTSKITITAPTREQMVALRSMPDGEAADRAVLGDQADAVFELYSKRPIQEWEAFVTDLYAHFFGKGGNDVEGKSEPSSS